MKYDLLKIAEYAESTGQKIFAEALRWAHEQIVGSSGIVSSTGDFAPFWAKYPNKTGKPVAGRAWKTARRKATTEIIMLGLDRWLAYWKARNEPQFIPHPSTWLNQERWNDPTPTDGGSDNAGIEQAARQGLSDLVNGRH